MTRNYQLIQERCVGVVKWFNIERGYGFINTEDQDVLSEIERMGETSNDVFFHVSAMQCSEKPQTDDRVEFDLAYSAERNKVVALNVEILSNTGFNR